MADGDDSPFGTTPAVAANVPPPVVEAPMTNPEGALQTGLQFRAQHKAAMDARTREVDNVFSKQQLNIQNMSKMLEDTTNALKESKQGRSNLGLMALGAGMMSSPGNFGTQLGAGVKNMIPVIQKDRSDEEDTQFKLMQIAMRRAGIENAPLEQKLAYLRAMQSGDEAGMRATETAIIRAQGQTESAATKAANMAPKSLGSGYIWDPRANGGKGAIVNMKGEITDPSKLATLPDGTTSIGSDLHGEDFLKTIKDPVLRNDIKSWGDYSGQFPNSSGRGLEGSQFNNLQRALVMQYNPDWQQNEYATLGKAMKDWTGNGKRAFQVTQGKAATGHIEQLQEKAANLSDNDMPWVNRIVNAIQTGTSLNLSSAPDSVKGFESMVVPFVDEMTKFYGTGQVAQAEKEKWLALLNSANSPKMLQTVLNQFVMAMHTQYEVLAEAKTQDMGGKKLRMHGPGERYTTEEMLGDKKDVPKNVVANDISTEEGRLAVQYRGENRKRAAEQDPAKPLLPTYSPAQWKAAIARLRENPDLAAEFDKEFGQEGLAKKLLGR